jgi:hypothetical protein
MRESGARVRVENAADDLPYDVRSQSSRSAYVAGVAVERAAIGHRARLARIRLPQEPGQVFATCGESRQGSRSESASDTHQPVLDADREAESGLGPIGGRRKEREELGPIRAHPSNERESGAMVMPAVRPPPTPHAVPRGACVAVAKDSEKKRLRKNVPSP